MTPDIHDVQGQDVDDKNGSQDSHERCDSDDDLDEDYPDFLDDDYLDEDYLDVDLLDEELDDYDQDGEGEERPL